MSKKATRKKVAKKAPAKRRGRPRKIDAIMANNWANMGAAIAVLELGLCRKDAAVKLGITRQTFADYMQRGAVGEQPFDEFHRRIVEAETNARETYMQRLASHTAQSWGAAAWYLERRHPEDFGAKAKIDVEHSQKEDLSRLSPEERADLRKMLSKARGERVTEIVDDSEY